MNGKLIAIVAGVLGIEDRKKITPETTLERLGADSLDIVDLVISIEDVFDVNIDDDDMEKLKTVQDLINYIPNEA